jgi:aryl-alcohol dehydrogenase-like predicted oxidoreductase
MRFVRSSLLNQNLSVLGFGSAAVLGRVGRRDSLRALSVAYDLGINVFDTARSYGYGESEALLGEFLQGRRAQVVVSSKFGIMPVRQSVWKQAVKPIVRSAMHFIPALSRSIQGQVAAQLRPGQFTVATLHDSITTSLRKLRTDYLDILFMHEASMEAIHDDELLRALEKLVEAGKVRMIGVSAEPAGVVAALKLQAVKAIQFACHIGNGFADSLRDKSSAGSVLRVANHPFGGMQGSTTMLAKFNADGLERNLPSSLREKLLKDSRHAVLADVVLNNALAGNDVVLATMMNPAHLRTNAEAVSSSRFEPSELATLRTWLIGPDIPPQSEERAVEN